MVGEDGSPIRWEEYCLVTSGGKKIKGYLDGNGWARIEGLEDGGQCEIGFPALDQEAWEFLNALPAR
jgi:hypothetical protein